MRELCSHDFQHRNHWTTNPLRTTFLTCISNVDFLGYACKKGGKKIKVKAASWFSPCPAWIRTESRTLRREQVIYESPTASVNLWHFCSFIPQNYMTKHQQWWEDPHHILTSGPQHLLQRTESWMHPKIFPLCWIWRATVSHEAPSAAPGWTNPTINCSLISVVTKMNPLHCTVRDISNLNKTIPSLFAVIRSTIKM